jgi:hypothetical protein
MFVAILTFTVDAPIIAAAPSTEAYCLPAYCSFLNNPYRRRRRVFTLRLQKEVIYNIVDLQNSTPRRMHMWPLAQMTCIASSIYATRQMRN